MLLIFFRCPTLMLRAAKPRYPFGPEGKEKGNPTLNRSLNDWPFRDPPPFARTGVITPVRSIHRDQNGWQSQKTSGWGIISPRGGTARLRLSRVGVAQVERGDCRRHQPRNG